MANYVKATNFYTKDALLTGNPAKIIKGAEIDAEYNAIATAVNSKADTTSPTFTGTPQAPTATAGNNSAQLATTAFVSGALSTLGNMSTQAKSAVDITGGTIAGVTVAGTFTGNITGNVTGNVIGNVTGSSGSCTGNAATATSAANAIGVGQTWQDVTASRAASTTYTNSTGRPIFISVRMAQDDGTLELTVDSLMIGKTGTTAGPVNYTVTGIIPASSTYQITSTGGTLFWYELR